MWSPSNKIYMFNVHLLAMYKVSHELWKVFISFHGQLHPKQSQSCVFPVPLPPLPFSDFLINFYDFKLFRQYEFGSNILFRHIKWKDCTIYERSISMSVTLALYQTTRHHPPSLSNLLGYCTTITNHKDSQKIKPRHTRCPYWYFWYFFLIFLWQNDYFSLTEENLTRKQCLCGESIPSLFIFPFFHDWFGWVNRRGLLLRMCQLIKTNNRFKWGRHCFDVRRRLTFDLGLSVRYASAFLICLRSKDGGNYYRDCNCGRSSFEILCFVFVSQNLFAQDASCWEQVSRFKCRCTSYNENF